MRNLRLEASKISQFVPVSDYEMAQAAFNTMKLDAAIDVLLHAIADNAGQASGDDGVSVAQCWALIAQCHFWDGRVDEARDIAAFISSHGDYPSECLDRWVLQCIMASIDGQYELSLGVLTELIESILANGDLEVSELLLHRGYAALRLGHLDAALVDFDTGCSIARLLRNRRLQIEFANFIGVVLHMQGKYERAIESYTSSLEMCAGLDSEKRKGRIYLNLGVCHYRLGRYLDSIALLEQAHSVLEKENDRINCCRVFIALGNVQRLCRDYSEARKHLTRAYETSTSLHATREQSLSLEFLGDVYRDEGKFEDARRFYQRGLAIAEQLAPEGDLICELLRRDGECQVLNGDAHAGLEMLARALRHARKLGDRCEEGIILRCLAQGFIEVKDLERASEYALRASVLLEEINARHEHAIARLVAADILLRQSETTQDRKPRDLLDQAWENAVIAQGIFLKLDIEYWTQEVSRLQSRIMKRRVEEQKYEAGIALVESPAAQKRKGRSKPLPTIMIAESRAMKEVIQAATAFAPYDETVLVTGETGTGKELVAQMLHQCSKRKDKPLVAINISAVPPSMFERELFGHVRGAFSGAEADSGGYVTAAAGGTLFFDEIGEVPPELQVKLLRLLQDGSYSRLGDSNVRYADVRVIAATNRNLEQATTTGQFRDDLFYRLTGLEIHVPPLRERRDDILPLLQHYLSCFSERVVSVDQFFNHKSQQLLLRHTWPGNVRELVQVARKAVMTLERTGRVELTLSNRGDPFMLTSDGESALAAAAGGQSSSALSRAHIMLALEECKGNRAEAARHLGISRSSLYRRLAQLGID